MFKPTTAVDVTSFATTTADPATRHTDVLIIGAGLAGLSTALSLPTHLNITVLSKSALDVCSSHYAQGGIAASLDATDSVQAHVADTLIAGAALCDADNTQRILGAGQDAIAWLCAQGVPFTKNEPPNESTAGNLCSDDISTLHLTKEGGHGCRRVVHAEDATGRYVMQSLIAKATVAAHITLLPYHEALELLTVHTPAGTRCRGAQIYNAQTSKAMTIHAQAVVLASGGLGQLFARASAPDVCVGDGVMMAWQAGCRLANLEFVQFHPTGLAVAGSSFLISEALRGEGGYLYCPKTGKRFMLAVDERAELAPRDIVARAIAEQINHNGLGYVHLDVSHLQSDFIKGHFPQIYQTLLNLGIDITRDPIPVAPTAHYSCGGVVTNADGLTDVAGLYAAGEVAYTGLHGANRLASNSLLECVVVGRNIATHLPNYVACAAAGDDGAINMWQIPYLPDTKQVSLPMSAGASFGQDPVSTSSLNTTVDPATITMHLKTLMSEHIGIVRHGDQLLHALAQVQTWQRELQVTQAKNEAAVPLNCQKNVDKCATLSPLVYLRLQRQLQLATLIIHAAYQRCESRGGHARADYPSTNQQAQVSIIAPQVLPPLSPLSSQTEQRSAVNRHDSTVSALAEAEV